MDLLVALAVHRSRERVPLLRGVDLRLTHGMRLGLVGANGAGKSTLLRILAGQEAPDDGRVIRAPGVRVGVLAQHEDDGDFAGSVWRYSGRAIEYVRALERRMRDEERRIAEGEDRAAAYTEVRSEFERVGGYGAEAMLREYLAALGFPQAVFDEPVDALSAGERRRLMLAVTLASSPDVLLLDEPTNHLDILAREWLATRLARHAGAMVIVSHDRALLDASTTHTAFLAAGALQLVPGRYGVARRRHDARLDAADRRARERAKEADRLARMAEELAAFGKKAQRRRKAAERSREELLAGERADGLDVADPVLGAALEQRNERPVLGRDSGPSERHLGGGPLVDARHLSAGNVVRDATFRLVTGDRVVLVGPNGSGKSTLLALLRGDMPSTDPRAELTYAPRLKLVHVDQRDRGLARERPVLDQLGQELGAGAAKRLLANAGVPQRAWNEPPERLSGGERARAGLAFALAHDADLWLLDEPTNDLDLEAVVALEEALERKLEDENAALVLVTHDRALAERVATQVWALVDGRLRRYAIVAAFLEGRPLAGSSSEAGGTLDDRRAQGTALDHGLDDDASPDPEPGTPHGARTPHVVLESASVLEDQVRAVEDERTALLRRLSDPLSLSERDAGRLRERLAAVEDWLVQAYDARFEPPAPRYRVVEHGLALFADALIPGAPGAGERDTGRAPQMVLVAAVTPADAARLLADLARWTQDEERCRAQASSFERAPGVAAWLELGQAEGVVHMRLVSRPDACLLPLTASALADGGARLAFTALGAKAVQLFHRAPLPGTLLAPAGDGWWSLGRRDFLRHEGWGEAESTAPSRRRRRRG